MLRFFILSILLLTSACKNQVSLGTRDGWVDGINITSLECPISDFTLNDEKLYQLTYQIEPEDINIKLIQSEFLFEKQPFKLEIAINGKKIEELDNIQDLNNLINISFDNELKDLRYLETHTIVISDPEFSECSLIKTFSIVCPSGTNYMTLENNCSTCAVNEIYSNQACQACPGRQLNNGLEICACPNDAINETCDECAIGQVYLAASDSCGTCNINEIYIDQACIPCPGRQINNGNNLCFCENNAINETCDECPQGQVYLAASDSCGTCNANEIYIDQACQACPGRQVNDGNNNCICTNNAINEDCNLCPDDQVYLAASDSCGTCNNNEIYINQACQTCPGRQVNDGNNNCVCTNNAINEDCNLCPPDLLYLANTDSCGTCNSNEIYINQACQTCPGNQINNGNNECYCSNGTINETCTQCPDGSYFLASSNSCGTCPEGTYYLANSQSCGLCEAPDFYEAQSMSCQSCSTFSSYEMFLSPTADPWAETITFENNASLFLKFCIAGDCLLNTSSFSLFVRHPNEDESQNIALPTATPVAVTTNIIESSLVGKVGGTYHLTAKEVHNCTIAEKDITIQAPCIPGKRLALWLDTNNDGIEDLYKGAITTYAGSDSANTNYNYYSASAHPIVGPTPIGFESHVFFYEDSSGLNLNFYHNIDEAGSADNIVHWDIYTSGNSLADSVQLSDDNSSELYLATTDTQNSTKKYEGRFHYWYNTDGGVIGPFNGTEFKIRVVVIPTTGNDNINAAFYSADGTALSLLDSVNNSISSFIITFENDESCNSD